jgi:alanine dehydrogenase
MVHRMRPGSVIVDFSIDQGGCVETSRPTTLRVPTFTTGGTIHHCVPNITAAVARTTSYAITNAALPYLLAFAAQPLETVFGATPALRRGVNLFRGRLAHPQVAAALGQLQEIYLEQDAEAGEAP